jgi:hypothetical protein
MTNAPTLAPDKRQQVIDAAVAAAADIDPATASPAFKRLLASVLGMNKGAPKVGKIVALKNECCALFGVSWLDVETKRDHRLRSAKQWFAYNALKAGFSTTRVGQVMKAHHTTVMRNAALYQKERNAPPVTGFVLND